MAPKKETTGEKKNPENKSKETPQQTQQQQQPQEPQNPVNESKPPEKQENPKKQGVDQTKLTYHRDRGWIPKNEDKKKER